MIIRLATQRALYPKGPESLLSFQNKGLPDPSDDDDDIGSNAGMDPQTVDPCVPPPNARESVPKGSSNRGLYRGDTLVIELRNAQEFNLLYRRLRR